MTRLKDYPASSALAARYHARFISGGRIESSLEFDAANWLGVDVPMLEAAIREHLARTMWSMTNATWLKPVLLDQRASALTLVTDAHGDPRLSVTPARDDDELASPLRDLLLKSARDVYRRST